MLEGFTPWPEARATFYREQGCWEGKTLAQLLADQALRHPQHIAVKEGTRQCTYEMLWQRSQQLAAGLKSLGIEKEDRVVVQLPNTIAFVETIFALFIIGALPVFALPAHRYNEIQYFCAFSEAKAYITQRTYDQFDYETIAHRVKAEVASLQHVIVVGETTFTPYNTLFSEQCYTHIDATSSDVAFLQLSGGTTGLSKLIPRTHDEYIYTLKKSNEICRVTADTIFLVVLPVAHNYPMSSPGILGVIYAGGTIVMSQTASPDEAFPLIAQERITMVALVPPIAIHWLFAKKMRTDDLSSLRVMLVGGAKLSVEVAKQIEPSFGCRLQQVFGMAEGLVNYTRLDDPIERIVTTQGKPLSPFDEIKVVDEEDREVPIGTSGFLLTRGPYTIQGYYKAPTHNAKSFTADGFYRTGDIVSVDEDGYITVTGRDKDQVNRGGEKIAAEEIENHLLAHPAVKDAAIVAMPDRFLGEKTCAFIVKHQDVDKKALIDFLAHRGIATYKIPDRIEWIDAFPQTALGKVNKKALRQKIEQIVGV